MLRVLPILLLLSCSLREGHSGLLCGRRKAVVLGGAADEGAGALALALVQPPPAPSAPGQSAPGTPAPAAPCKLRISAPNATAFTLRLIDAKDSLLVEYERANTEGRKWSARAGPHAQHTAPEPAPAPANASDACKLFIYTGESRSPAWRLNLCGANAAALAARAGSRLLPPRIKLVWNPPASPHYHTEKLRLVVTAVNSGAICKDVSQFTCGATELCVSASLVCDDVRHCPGGEDESEDACSRRQYPPMLEFLRRLTARNPELLGVDPPDTATKPSVISDFKLAVKISETEQKGNAFTEFSAALKPYGPWGYLVMGMLICAIVLMFCLAWECCCKTSKPSDTPMNIPAACIDLAPTMTISATQSSELLLTQPLPSTPPAYEPPPSYSSLFPRAFKSSPTPVPHCSHQAPPD